MYEAFCSTNHIFNKNRIKKKIKSNNNHYTNSFQWPTMSQIFHSACQRNAIEPMQLLRCFHFAIIEQGLRK